MAESTVSEEEFFWSLAQALKDFSVESLKAEQVECIRRLICLREDVLASSRERHKGIIGRGHDLRLNQSLFKRSSLSNAIAVAIFPSLFLWRRSLC